MQLFLLIMSILQIEAVLLDISKIIKENLFFCLKYYWVI